MKTKNSKADPQTQMAVRCSALLGHIFDNPHNKSQDEKAQKQQTNVAPHMTTDCQKQPTDPAGPKERVVLPVTESRSTDSPVTSAHTQTAASGNEKSATMTRSRIVPAMNGMPVCVMAREVA